MDAPQLGHLFSDGSLYFLLPLAIAFVIFYQRLTARKLPLPPSPPGDFLVGHVFKIPHFSAGIVYAEWAKQYGMFVIRVKHFDQLICWTKAIFFV